MNTLKHLAIIMDGNGRWAERQGLSRTRGHIAGARRAFEIVEWLANVRQPDGLETITLFGFSTENWCRPESEVTSLMRLIAHSLRSRLSFFEKHDIRVFIIGEKTKLPMELQKVINDVESATANCGKLNLVFAINYSGQWDILQAVDRSRGRSQDFAANLCTARFDSVDLMIRTGGEQRISNFLLWPLAYAELHFCDRLWPDLTPEELSRVLARFQDTDRRFGRVSRR